MTSEEAKNPEVLENVDEAYAEATDFLVGLTAEEQSKVYREGMLAFAYHLSNMSDNPEAQFKVLFINAIKVGAERSGLKKEEN